MQALGDFCGERFPQLLAPLMREQEQYTVAVMRSLTTRCIASEYFGGAAGREVTDQRVLPSAVTATSFDCTGCRCFEWAVCVLASVGWSKSTLVKMPAR